MLPPLLLNPAPGARVLDMCASPGGKTSLLALLAGEQGFVLGNEPSRSRLETLRRNLHRMNAASCATCSGPGEGLPLAEGSWPAILLDPPCSGWGTVDKNPSVTTIWRDEKTEPLVRLQRALLAKASELLAPGGVILYSTCTTNPRENEEQARFALDELGLDLEPLPAPPGFVGEETSVPGTEGVLRVDGRASDAQGFFLARLRKPGVSASEPLADGDLPGRALSAAEVRAVADAGADAVSCINTLSGMAVDARTRRPRLANVVGGLSGPAIKPVALRCVWQVARAVDIPVIGIGGISCAEDVLEFILVGATAVQVGTANFMRPDFAFRLVDEVAVLARELGIESWDEYRGSLRV